MVLPWVKIIFGLRKKNGGQKVRFEKSNKSNFNELEIIHFMDTYLYMRNSMVLSFCDIKYRIWVGGGGGGEMAAESKHRIFCKIFNF